ncbi:MAG TPA: metal-dependent hydrolase [Thermoanaerobaculia bacterium]|nr:metal-dependent hydrolase [Thermoanaerobaculia bacterium]
MPTIFSHPAVPLGLAPWFRRVPRSLIALAAFVSSVPDADVAAFGFGIPYDHPLGHRGFTHSICFAVLFAAFAAFAYVRLAKNDAPFRLAFTFLFLALLSHGLLDAMTDGGKGIGFFIPFSNARYFLPFRPIRVSPIGAGGFAEEAGVVLGSELRWVWGPFAAIALLGVALRRLKETT